MTGVPPRPRSALTSAPALHAPLAIKGRAHVPPLDAPVRRVLAASASHDDRHVHVAGGLPSPRHPAGRSDGTIDRWQLAFPSYEAALESEMIFEVRYDGALLDRLPGPRCAADCKGFDGETPRIESISMCAYPHGELRVFDVTCTYETGGCVADALCRPSCFPTIPIRCEAGQKCGRIVTHDDPTFGVLDCAPDGNVALGDACSIGPVGRDTGYDTCASGAVCIEGVCVEMCGSFEPCSDGGACTPIPGLPADFGACL